MTGFLWTASDRAPTMLRPIHTLSESALLLSTETYSRFGGRRRKIIKTGKSVCMMLNIMEP